MERIYGSVEDVKAELQGRTEFDSDIELQCIERIAEIERDDGVTAQLDKVDWTVLAILAAVSIIGSIVLFMQV